MMLWQVKHEKNKLIGTPGWSFGFSVNLKLDFIGGICFKYIIRLASFAGIEPRTFASLALARSHPQLFVNLHSRQAWSCPESVFVPESYIWPPWCMLLMFLRLGSRRRMTTRRNRSCSACTWQTARSSSSPPIHRSVTADSTYSLYFTCARFVKCVFLRSDTICVENDFSKFARS
jgi:hypothetical protein